MVSVTIDSDTYEAYANQSTANTFLNADYKRQEAWNALSTDQKGRALVSAARRLDRLTWKGEKTSASQALAWPRTGVKDCDGNDIGSSSVPQAVIDASILLAYDITQTPDQADDTSTKSNINRVVAGSVEVEFFREHTAYSMPTHLRETLRCLLSGGSTALTDSFGTDVDPFFGQDLYDRSEGFA